ncbi:coiled-coil domain-containing protein 40-like [Ptychodera flava]|uniref:coiled-coil domain-containing protein 40-like n=1 Tax=Ptychodera flava TaxID=63121 RepID=UPI00396A9A1C
MADNEDRPATAEEAAPEAEEAAPETEEAPPEQPAAEDGEVDQQPPEDGEEKPGDGEEAPAEEEQPAEGEGEQPEGGDEVEQPGEGEEAEQPVEEESAEKPEGEGEAPPEEAPVEAKPPSGPPSRVSSAKSARSARSARSQRSGSRAAGSPAEQQQTPPPPSAPEMEEVPAEATPPPPTLAEEADRPASGRSGGSRRSAGGARSGSGRQLEDNFVAQTDITLPDDIGVLDADSDGDDFADEEGDEEEEEMESDESEEESEMVVLDPDHPLMKRFQIALKAQLSKQNEKVTLELRELLEGLKNRKKEREDLGVNLYGLQQELARQQMLLEKLHDEFGQTKQVRHQCEEELEEVRHFYKYTQSNITSQRKTASELQTEVENLATRIFYMMNAKEDVRSDIAVMRRAAEKADSEVTKAETEKQKQDLYVDRLTEVVDKLREEIALYEAQLQAQSEETKAAKESLSEAKTEIESINLEKKHLLQQWHSSLIGMRRRDEAHAAMQEALSLQKQNIMSYDTEIEGYKKSIQKEQENNETLTIILNKNDADIATTKKLIQQCQDKQEKLKQEYSTFTRMLHETEQSLNRATTDRSLRMNELNALRKQIEREYQEKVRLEDAIMEKMREELTMDKAAIYTKKMTDKLRARTREQEASMAQVENEIARDTLELSHTVTRCERLKKVLTEYDEEIRSKNEIISKSESEIVKRNAVIERKQGQIDQYNKKIEAIASAQGGEELGPLEQEINALTKSIDQRSQEIADLQQFWLRQQNELVKLTKEKDSQETEVGTMKKALTILHQKKYRIENEINTHNKEEDDIQRNIRNMQNDMIKLNTLLTKEGKLKEDLEQGNVLVESDFVQSLKEAERESIQMQSSVQEMTEEKERLLNSLVEAERQIMLWEKKTQLAREAKAAVDSEVGQGEIRAMRAEIHRMQVRYTQLMKQQEKMIQDMEKAVSRRDTIVTRGDAQAKMDKKVETKGTFKKKLAEMKKKIKQVQQDANACDGDISELRGHQQQLSQQLEEKQTTYQQLQSQADTYDGDIEQLMEIKQRNMVDLIARQQKLKHYHALKDGKYTMLCKTEQALETETQKQIDRMQTITTIVDRVNQEYPHIQPALRKVSLSLGSRGLPTDED